MNDAEREALKIATEALMLGDCLGNGPGILLNHAASVLDGMGISLPTANELRRKAEKECAALKRLEELGLSSGAIPTQSLKASFSFPCERENCSAQVAGTLELQREAIGFPLQVSGIRCRCGSSYTVRFDHSEGMES